MKGSLLTISFLLALLTSFGQSSVGLVAHWNMDNNTNDTSGNGHNGHGHNITSVNGWDGTPNAAYHFNGTTSYISTGYLPDLQLTQYSICAIVRPTGFYSGTCQGNFIMTRGKSQTAGSYTLQFTDNPNDANDCFAFDSTQEVFQANAGSTGSGGPGIHNWSYLPSIIENHWYKVVATWDGTQYQIFVNDTLKTTLVSVTGTFGSSADSIAIGLNIFDMAYPFGFTGDIDDLRIYNRVLADTEVHHYGSNCGLITTQPDSVYTTIGSNVSFYVTTTMTLPSFQWQIDSASTFVNLANGPHYTGVNTDTLKVIGVTSAVDHRLYRCLISNDYSCTDTTRKVALFAPSGINNIHSVSEVQVYPNPTTGQLNVEIDVPEATIQIINTLGQTVLDKQIKHNYGDLDVSSLRPGTYVVRISSGETKQYQRFLKL